MVVIRFFDDSNEAVIYLLKADENGEYAHAVTCVGDVRTQVYHSHDYDDFIDFIDSRNKLKKGVFRS